MGWLIAAGYFLVFLVTCRLATRYYLTKTDLDSGPGDRGFFGLCVIGSSLLWPVSLVIWAVWRWLVEPVWNAPDRVSR